MRMAARWGLVITVSAAAFALSWWVCQAWIRMDEPASIGVASAVLTMVLAVAGWWAAREQPGGKGAGAGPPRVVQKAHAGRDIHMAGRDQTVTNCRRRNE